MKNVINVSRNKKYEQGIKNMTRTLYVTKIHEKCYQDIKEWKI